jgi:hypothetical protein
VLQARSQVTAGAEEKRLDGPDADPELVRDLSVREPLPFAEEDPAALIFRQVSQAVSERGEPLVPLVADGRRRSKLVDVLDLLGQCRLASGGAADAAADVECDLE